VSAGQLRLDRELFLARHWQREPLLIRNAIPGFSPPVSAEELAGLAMEDGVEARIIEQVDGSWRQLHGPFGEADFRRRTPWTLLVQAVDQHLEEVARLRALVDFLPSWRFDDVMVSYAVDGGSVGPHFDHYDVFLLQGQGERLWRLGQRCDESTPLLPHEELRILERFERGREYLLGPGDMLYVPPGVAHWGIARGACTTFSLGFRAPRVGDMVSRWVDQLLEGLPPDLFYADSHAEPVSRPGEIRPRDRERARAQLQAALDQEVADRWFGELVTEPRYEPAPDDDDLAEARALLADGPRRVTLAPASRIAWQQEADGVTVFVNGQSQRFAATTLRALAALCAERELADEALAAALADGATAGLLDYLLELGGIYVD